MSAYPLTAISDAVDDLSVYMALWAQRDASKTVLPVDLAGQNALAAIDVALSELHGIRSVLVGEVRQHQDAGYARIDAMLAERRDDR